MLQAVSLRPEPITGVSFAGLAASVRKATRDGVRMVVIAVGLVLMAGGFVLALLPGHLGLPLLVIGLILVLRNSPSARRQFIHLQRRHPRVVFPLRRLIRRDPEIFPVLWQTGPADRASDRAPVMAPRGALAAPVFPGEAGLGRSSSVTLAHGIGRGFRLA